MLNKLRKWIGKGINYVLSFIGLKIIRKIDVKTKRKKKKKKKEQFIWERVALLPKVPTLIDIGVGPEGTYPLYEHFPDAQFVFIDPLEECKQSIESKLKNEKNRFINTAVGATNSFVEINVARKTSRSSIYKRKGYLSEAVEKRRVALQRLDDILDDLDLDKPLGIKIDTEGYELEVLKGAPNSLNNAIFVILEFHLKDAIRNGYSLDDLIRFMDKSGFYACFLLRDGRNIVFISKKYSQDEILDTKILFTG